MTQEREVLYQAEEILKARAENKSFSIVLPTHVSSLNWVYLTHLKTYAEDPDYQGNFYDDPSEELDQILFLKFSYAWQSDLNRTNYKSYVELNSREATYLANGLLVLHEFPEAEDLMSKWLEVWGHPEGDITWFDKAVLHTLRSYRRAGGSGIDRHIELYEELLGEEGLKSFQWGITYKDYPSPIFRGDREFIEEIGGGTFGES